MGQIIGEGITFDDVLLVPSYSQVIPNQVDLTTWLTKKIKLNIPQEGLFVHHHPKYGDIYGVSFLQMWIDSHNGSNIEDDMLGYIFLMIDFKKDENRPTIHVRTWQPKSNITKRTDKYNLMDFKIYDY